MAAPPVTTVTAGLEQEVP